DGGAAAEAGIKAGDVILKVNDVEVNKVSELQEQIGRYRPGQQISVTVLHGEKTRTMNLTLRNIDGGTSLQTQGETMEILGASVRTVNPQTASSLRIRGGVEITALADGKFKQAGIKEGFIITSVNRHPMRSADELKAILSNSKGGIYIEGVYPNGKSAYYAFGI
ncbi:MAG: PDZ domain-containing protein, partial [Salinivirgaceae bacterium]|nr:PDZ domain-containing protein [Salinivirgaceae bacterium]